MALNKAMKAALKVLSYPDIHLKKNYKLVRLVNQVAHPDYIPRTYKKWDRNLQFEDHEIPLRIFSPDDHPGHQLIIYFHGGGWVIGNIDSYTQVCAKLARITGRTVISVDYRLAPEYPYPAAPNECYFAAKMIFNEYAKQYFDADPDKIVLMGDSAGGNLAAVVSLMAKETGEFQPKTQVLIYPAVNNDFSDDSPFASIKENGKDYLLTQKRLCDYMDLYMGKQDRNQPHFAPLLADDLSEQPRTLVVTAEFDPLRDEGEAYAEKLARFGNDVTLHRVNDVLHGFFALPLRYEPVKATYELVRDFILEGEKNTCPSGQEQGCDENEKEKGQHMVASIGQCGKNISDDE